MQTVIKAEAESLVYFNNYGLVVQFIEDGKRNKHILKEKRMNIGTED